MKKILLLFILALPFFVIAQNDCEIESCEKEVKNKKIWGNAKYTGCVNLFDEPHGYGTQIFKTQTSSGCWKDGKKNGNFTIILKDGFEKYCVYKNDNQEKCRTMLDHNYDPNDIITTKKSFDIELINNNNHDYIKVTIDNKDDVFLYDTGASQNTLKRDLFNTIPKYLYKKLYKTKGKNSTYKIKIADGSYVTAEFYLFKRITIQNIEIQNVIFSVATKGGSNLIGQDFWNKFSKKNPPNEGKIKVFK